MVLLGLYLHSLQRELVEGALDAELRALAARLRDLELPVLLRVGYEFNNPWERAEPAAYVAGFRRVAQLLREERACNVATVWHASVLGLASGPADPWFPGADVVDWWGVSLFHFEELASAELGGFLEAARRHHRPVVIGEAAPVLASHVPGQVRGPRDEAEALRWLDALFELIHRRPEIRALSLISVDWRRLEDDLRGWGWPEARPTRWPRVVDRLRAALADTRFLHRSGRDELARRLTPGCGAPEH